jgi:hypothetical protein
MTRWECEYCGSEGTAPDGEVVEQMSCPHCGEPLMEVG